VEPGRSDPLLGALKDIRTCKGRPWRLSLYRGPVGDPGGGFIYRGL